MSVTPGHISMPGGVILVKPCTDKLKYSRDGDKKEWAVEGVSFLIMQLGNMAKMLL